MSAEHAVTAEASLTSKNLSKVALLRVAQYPFIALFALVVPRLMGPDTYGRYALFVSYWQICGAFVDFGITEISARAVPELERNASGGISRYFSRMLGFKASIDLLLVAVLGIGSQFFVQHLSKLDFIWPMALAVLFSDVGGTGCALLFGLNRMAQYSARDPLRRAFTLAAVVVLFEKFGLGGAIYSGVVVEVVLATMYLVWTRSYVSAGELVPSWRYAAPLLRYGALFYLSWGVTNIWQKLGDALITYLHGNFSQVAIFDLSNQIFLTVTGFTLFIVASLAPMFTRLRLDGKDSKLIDWSRRILTYSLIACVMVFGGWLLLGPNLIPIVFGSRYNGLYENVAVLLCGAFPMVVVQLGYTLVMAYAEPARYLTGLIVAVVSFIAASLVLIPLHGALGCSFATLLSCFCCSLTIGAHYRAILRRSLLPGLKALLAGALVLAPCWFYRGAWMRNASLTVAFLAGFALLLWIGNIVSRQEVREAWRAFRHKEA